MGLGYRQEGAVSVSTHCEDEGLPREDSQVAHHLPWVGDKQQALLLSVYHPLVHMEQPRDDERHTHILREEVRVKVRPGLCVFVTAGFITARYNCVIYTRQIHLFIDRYGPRMEIKVHLL